MKKTIILTLACTSLLFCAELTGRDIMKNVEDRLIPKDMKSEMTMDLINKRGQVRNRKVKVYRKGDTKQIMWFLEPADVKGTSYLYIENPDGSEDMWLYLPAFQKIRRIVSSAKKENFMGSDFTYEDMSNRKLNEYTYKRLDDDSYGKYDCYVVESQPKEGNDISYQKIISWVWKDTPIVLKEELYNRFGDLHKIKIVSGLKKYNQYWIPESFSMEDIIKNHKTTIAFDKIEVDTGVSDSFFSSRYLKRVVY